ncbi:MAG: fructose-6-phosphate aldolase [Deltaproteobacteria bacterium]|nr:fructose-6-phosphate aldolase [Deltaproteobacteria bacterium]
MKFFIDSADIQEIKKAVSMGFCDGVTTNPSLVARTGRPFKDVIRDLMEIVPGPVSLEAVSENADGMVEEARGFVGDYPDHRDKIFVKIPMTPEGMVAVRRCADEGINTNVTLVFTATQALLAAKAGASYVSPFIGRLDDISTGGMQIIEDIVRIYDNYDYDTEIIVASIRHPMHVLESALIGADIATIPFSVVLKLFNHPLTDKGIAKFLEDNSKIPE